MQWRLPLLIAGLLLTGLVQVSADWDMTEEEIWNRCWSYDQGLSLRHISYPNPIHLTIHNISLQDWKICVFDNLCPYALYKGLLRHNHSISLSACANQWGRGSVSIMNADGEMWHFQDTGDRIITIKK